MAYPLSTDVTDGQPTSYLHYNNLRADALRFSQAAADAVNLGNAMSRFMLNFNLQPLAANRLRVPFVSTAPPTLVIDGYLCQATADVDLAAGTFSGAAATWYIFANRAAGATTFTLTANTSLTESAGQRRVGMIYWDGANCRYSDLHTYRPGQPHLYFAHVRRNAVQSIPNITYTAVSWDTLEADTDSLYAGAAPTRLTIQHAGFYVVTFQLQFASSPSISMARIWLNGTTSLAVQKNNTDYLNATTLHYLAATDYIEALAYQSSGAPLNTAAETYISIAALAAA